MVSMDGAFDFVDGGRAYACRVEAPHRGRAEAWWWFAVAGDPARYAPFRAAVGDTEASVRPRVVAYYEDRLARRPMPWMDRGDTAPAPAPADGASFDPSDVELASTPVPGSPQAGYLPGPR